MINLSLIEEKRLKEWSPDLLERIFENGFIGKCPFLDYCDYPEKPRCLMGDEIREAYKKFICNQCYPACLIYELKMERIK